MSTELLVAILAAGLSAGGVLLLRGAWAQGGPRLWLPGWAMVLLSLFLWGRAVSADEGVALGLVVTVLAAMVVLGFNAFGSAAAKRAPRAAREAPEIAHERQPLHRTLFAVLVIGPGTGLAALSIAAASYAVLAAAGIEITAALTMVFFLFPLAWAALAVLAVMEKRPGVRAASVTGAALFPAIAVMMTG